MRLLALLVLLAVVPTFELAEQVEHLVEHILDGDSPDHSAHHDEQPGDEHGCTGLMHSCGHHSQVMPSTGLVAKRSTEISTSISSRAPASLADLTSLEPPQRPPIA